MTPVSSKYVDELYDNTVQLIHSDKELTEKELSQVLDTFVVLSAICSRQADEKFLSLWAESQNRKRVNYEKIRAHSSLIERTVLKKIKSRMQHL